jgi:hypothetical protein
MKVPSLGITQHFTDEVNRVLDLVISVLLLSFHDDCHTNHIACSQYIKMQVFVGFWGHQGGWGSQILLQVFEALLCLLSPLELVLILRSLKKGSPLMPSHEMNLLKVAIRPVNF